MIRYAKDPEHIVTLTLDMDGAADNLLNHTIVDAFTPVLAHLQREKSRGVLRGVIVHSAKPTFLSGGELEYLQQSEGPKEVFALTERLKRFLRDLERPGVPVVAALNGSALGIGFEFALACHHRVALDDPKAVFGFPEVNLGLMPGAGACIRLMWLLGVELAYPLLTSGHRYSPRQALNLGLVDELAETEEEMLERARRWLLDTPHGSRRWDRGEAIPGGSARRPHVSAFAVERAAALARDHQTHLPAYTAILATLVEGSKVDFDTALRIETRKYTALLSEHSAHDMINAFWFEKRQLASGANRPKGFGRFRVRKVGIVGAGLMGSGIGYACARAGIEVVVKDVSRAIALRGRELATAEINEDVSVGRLSRTRADRILGRMSFTERAGDFDECDLVIEAVFENENVKTKVIRETSERLDEYALLASNTLSIPITRLAEAAGRPEQFIGLHFFPPAQKVPLVEIVRGHATSDETVARAFDFVRAIRKLPILVKDDWGFYVARVQNTYVLEGITLLREGYPAALVDNLGLQLGFPTGPLALADQLGLQLVLTYESQAAEHYGERYVQHPAVAVIEELLAAGRGGKSQGGGFYDAPAASGDGERGGLWGELPERFPVTQEAYDRVRIEDRLLFAQVMEAGWCLHEGVIALVAEANLGSIHGWGFPANFGGVVQYARGYGAEEFAARAEDLEGGHGPRFKVPGRLAEVLAGARRTHHGPRRAPGHPGGAEAEPVPVAEAVAP